MTWLCRVGVVALFLGGIWAGWVAPRLDKKLPSVAAMQVSVDVHSQTPGVFLGADLTTLGVLIAIIIGYNVAAFQVAAQTLSLSLVRAVLYTLVPFLGLWLAATTIAMVYLLSPPPVVGDLYHTACWFGSTAFALIGYLLGLPSRLSGDYEAKWSVTNLRGVPISEWESTDGFTVLQTGINTAVGRADIGTLRMLVLPLAHVLSGRCDPMAERSPTYNRARFYALRDLLAGCAPFVLLAPGAIWYVLGYLEASIMLQAAAVGAPASLQHATLFDDAIPSGQAAPQNIVSLWAGLRHAMCRQGVQGTPYLRRFWREHADWPSNDERRVKKLADLFVYFHGACWRQMATSALSPSEVADQCAELLSEFYRYLWQYLPQDARSGSREKAVFPKEAGDLMKEIQDRVSAQWPMDQKAALDTLELEYATYKDRLDTHVAPSSALGLPDKSSLRSLP